MKSIFTLLLALTISVSYGQNEEFNTLLDSAITLFKSTREMNSLEHQQFDYNQVVSILEKALEIDSNNAEARYVLGYTYGRLNARDGRGIINHNLDLTYKSSQQFELINKFSPKYSGEIIALDPYSKISAEWGSLAMKYWYNNQLDSCVWAFTEGKKRGGYSDYILALNRSVLDACSKHAILMVSGDNLTFPLLYLQMVENYRTDVSVVDGTLLNTKWYPKTLNKKGVISFGISPTMRDSIEYMLWVESTVRINDFTWTMKPTYANSYILRGDRLLFNLLVENEFNRDVFFSFNYNKSQCLNLEEFLLDQIVVDFLDIKSKEVMSFGNYKKSIAEVLELSEIMNPNSYDERNLLEHFRFNLLNKAHEYLNKEELEKAVELFEILDKYSPEEKYPYLYEREKKYADQIRESL